MTSSLGGPISSPLRILHLEDNRVDADFARSMLEADGLVCDIQRVESGDGFASALADSQFDLIISDFSRPSFSGHAALLLARETAPDTPMLFFSGTAGEEAAIESLLSGASDYVLKERPERLPSAVRRALTDREQRVTRRRAEDKFRAAVEGAPAGVVLVNQTGAILLVNKQVEAQFGYERTELFGQPIERLVPALFGEAGGDRETYFAEPTARSIGYSRDLSGLRKDGIGFPVEVTLSPVETSDEGLVMATIINISERKLLEEQFRQAQKIDAIGQLTGGVAHDFNNLITVISCYAQLSLDALEPGSPIRADIEEISRAGDRAATLTRQLLAFSRKQVIEPRVLNLNQLVKDLDGMLRRLVAEDITLHCVLHPDMGCVRADPAQIEQVIINLVVNARDAMPEGGHLTIRTASAAPSATLSVADTGTGMSAETKRHMFEPFFTTKGPGKGTGLGLATVYGIVQQSNGSITVSTAVGEGTTFTMYLPTVEETAEPTTAGAKAVVTLKGTETILLVEDDSPLRTLTQTILRSSGYRVLTAANRDEALATSRIFAGDIHLMVTDVIMPGMSAADLTARMKELKPGMQTLYMSGYTDDTITRRGILIDGVSFLQKPFTPDGLLRKVKQVLNPTEPSQA